MSDDNQNLPPQFGAEDMRFPAGTGAPEVSEEHHNKLALILGLLIVALVLILGGLYLWYANAFQTTPVETPERVVAEMPNEPETANAEAAVQQLRTVSPADDLDSIEADLESTNFDELNAELNAIEAELAGQ